jgi:hypothetical protein
MHAQSTISPPRHEQRGTDSTVTVAPTVAYALTSLAIAGIWGSIILATVLAPDMISGSQHEHLPLVGFTYWVWGAIATGLVLQAAVENIRLAVTRSAWLALGLGVSVIWLAVLLVAVFAPVFITGTDPTRLPLAALGAPIAGVVLTSVLCGFIRAVEANPQTGSTPALAAPSAASSLRDLATLRDAGVITSDEFEAKKTELLGRM